MDCLVDKIIPVSGLQWLFCLHALEPNVAGDQWSEKQNTGGGGEIVAFESQPARLLQQLF